MPEKKHVERHPMKMWGRLLADMEAEPRSMPEAQLAVSMAVADKLTEVLTAFRDIQNRLYRLEAWLEDTAPGYTGSAAYQAHARGEQHAGPAALPAGFGTPGGRRPVRVGTTYDADGGTPRKAKRLRTGHASATGL